MLSKNLTVSDFKAYGVFGIKDEKSDELIAMSFFSRSRQLCKGIVACLAKGVTATLGWRERFFTQKNEFKAVYKPVTLKRDRFTLVTVVNKAVGTKWLITDASHLDQDIFNFLMSNSHLPIKEEWVPVLRERMLADRTMVANNSDNACWTAADCLRGADRESIAIPGLDIHGKNVFPREIRVFNMDLVKEGYLSGLVSELIADGTLKVAPVPSEALDFGDEKSAFDNYITKYGSALVKKLEGTIKTLSPLKGELDGFAAKNKRLYPQQAACINGLIALKKAGSRYGLMVEGMGCGKTLQGAAVADAFFNQQWLEKHPGKDLKDLYLSEDKPSYRNVLMAPSHLVQKWREEILSEIPGARVKIIKDLDCLLEIRANGKERNGREWYLLSKDFAKLGTMRSPIPANVGRDILYGMVCKDCLSEGITSWKKAGKSVKGKPKCDCGCTHFVPKAMPEYGKVYGMVCPQCGHILLKPSGKYMEAEDRNDLTLKPEDFAGEKASNETCFNCGAHLWGVNCKPVGGTPKESKWYKVTHFTNQAKKGTTTAWVLKGHEGRYYTAAHVKENEVKKTKTSYGPRRYAPASFIKKYLKGYFDMTVLDEAHKYENGGTAQANAAHALMSVSSLTLALTGTLTNGKADSLFYLFYMLDPRRMNRMGYKYTDLMNFVKTYGAVESQYEAGTDEDGKRNACSRGRMIGQPRVKPGISPKIFTDFLLEKSVFLDLSDLSKYLPELKEEVVFCECPDDVQSGYDTVIDQLKQQLRSKGGRPLLSTMLQFGLSYADKPYDRLPIMHPAFEDVIAAAPENLDHYKNGELLPKEQKLVEISNKEIAEGRNMFVYCAYTGAAETNITNRLKSILEKNCNLGGQVYILEASSPKAEQREAFIHEKAAEGIRVFICNMKLVETGLDFCFQHNGSYYNYPTIVFYQLTYELATMIQASRRAYRLIQKEECRNYYLVTEGTLQVAAVQIMAEKQVAASAIQGKFSVDGLAAMANGVDPRIKLAQMLAEGDDGADREELANMFDVMNSAKGDEDESKYGSYVPPKTYYELMDGDEDGIIDIEESSKVIIPAEGSKMEKKPSKKVSSISEKPQQLSIFDFGEELFAPKVVNAELLEEEKARAARGKKKAKKQAEGQQTIFDFFAA